MLWMSYVLVAVIFSTIGFLAGSVLAASKRGDQLAAAATLAKAAERVVELMDASPSAEITAAMTNLQQALAQLHEAG